MAVALHCASRDAQHQRFAVALPDFHRRLDVRREVDVMARALVQPAAFANGGESAVCGAVVKRLRRYARRVGEVNRDRMPLIGADFCAARVVAETLLRIGGDDVVQQGAVDGDAVRVQLLQERGDVRPALRVEGDANTLRLVTQDETEALADAGGGIWGLLHVFAV